MEILLTLNANVRDFFLDASQPRTGNGGQWKESKHN